MSDELYDHAVPLTMRADCACGHSAADHPVDLGGREAISFACLRSGLLVQELDPVVTPPSNPTPRAVKLDIPDEPRRWTLTHYDRPWTANKDRTLHFHARSDLGVAWRQAFMALANEAKVPRLDRIRVTVRPSYKNKGPRPDVAACYPAAKAAIDGLVDSHVIPDDNPDHLLSLTFLQPAMSAGRDALVLVIADAGPAVEKGRQE